MSTEHEYARTLQIRAKLLDLAIRLYGDDVSADVVDGLFAIHEGTSWRGITDPKEITREIADLQS